VLTDQRIVLHGPAQQVDLFRVEQAARDHGASILVILVLLGRECGRHRVSFLGPKLCRSYRAALEACPDVMAAIEAAGRGRADIFSCTGMSPPGSQDAAGATRRIREKSVSRYQIAVVRGDGIGPEVCDSAVRVVTEAVGKSRLDLVDLPAGAVHYQKTGSALPEETFQACAKADAILHGAAGIPGVVYADGTEAGIEFGLKLRFRLDIYANVRPIKLYPNVVSPLRGREAGSIDYVILRENTEGLYAARGGGNLLHNDIATDTMVITRKGTERIVRKAFELSRQRNGALLDGKRRVTCCDKANVLRSYAFFRSVFDDVAKDYPDIETDYAYADAIMVHMVKRPDFYDVIVTENMFGDIISDLGAVSVGGMGCHRPLSWAITTASFRPRTARPRHRRPECCKPDRHHPRRRDDAQVAG
jgi:3-isopropylmalate dehydrogenase